MKNYTHNALILGSSSGFGKATTLEFASSGYGIFGVHLDFGPSRKEAENFVTELRSYGVETSFYNANAADHEKRKGIVSDIKQKLAESGESKLRILVHSLAFGTLKPLIAQNEDEQIDSKGLEMTLDVMANSLVYWVQDLVKENLFAENSRIFAITSIASHRAWSHYGAVSAAKAAIESYIRQLAFELAPLRITANAICAGVSNTPAARKIPNFPHYLKRTIEHNPYHRSTEPVDVAKAIFMLSAESNYWMTGQIIGVDGGEGVVVLA